MRQSISNLWLRMIQLSRSQDILTNFEVRKNVLNKRDAMCEQVCMAAPRDKYYS